jgi:hypothetical protein
MELKDAKASAMTAITRDKEGAGTERSVSFRTFVNGGCIAHQVVAPAIVILTQWVRGDELQVPLVAGRVKQVFSWVLQSRF